MFPFEPLPEGVMAERTCECRRVAPYRVESRMVKCREHPTRQVPAIVVLASAQPPTVDREVVEDGQRKIVAVRNPKHNPLDMVVVATYELGFDICCKDCMLNEVDKLWEMADRRAKKMWGV